MSANEKHNLDALPSNYRPFTDAEADAAIKGIVLETAEVMWCYADVFNPYGLPGISSDCIGRDYFARTPGGPWIWFHDASLGSARRALAKTRSGAGLSGRVENLGGSDTDGPGRFTQGLLKAITKARIAVSYTRDELSPSGLLF